MSAGSLGYSRILVTMTGFLLFRTQHRGTRTPTRTRLLESTSLELHCQST
jgi:hypothetical protein